MQSKINKNYILFSCFILIIGVTSSCSNQSKSSVENQIKSTNIKVPDRTGNHWLGSDQDATVENQNSVVFSYDQYIDTRYEYTDSNNQHLVIENSLPKGGLKYTDPNGEEYVYAIFWTRITNETANPVELSIEFPANSFTLPSSPDNFFKMVLPSEKMTIEKASLFNYGLSNLNAVLDNKLQNSSSLQRIINSKEVSLFYVVSLFKKGVEGTIRAGLTYWV